MTRKHQHHRKKRHSTSPSREQLGSPAGTIHPSPDAQPTKIRYTRYDSNNIDQNTISDVKSLKKPDPNTSTVEWIDVVGLGDVDKIKEIGKTYDLHPLALADVVHRRQQPKAEAYGNVLFIVLRMVNCNNNAPPEYEQMSLFLGPGFVLTFQEDEQDSFDMVRERLREHQGKIREMRADYLAYCLIDAVIDDYYPAVERFADQLDSMEQEVISGKDAQVLPRLSQIKLDIQTLERNVRPARDAIIALGSVPSALVSEDTKLYLRDCLDHVLQIYDTVQNLRDSAAHLVQIYLGVSSQRLNEVIKVLTIITTIFIPLSFIAGIYGMNFDPDSSPYNMPELRWRWGYPVTLAVMSLIALAFLAFFRHKGWLGRRRDDKASENTS